MSQPDTKIVCPFCGDLVPVKRLSEWVSAVGMHPQNLAPGELWCLAVLKHIKAEDAMNHANRRFEDTQKMLRERIEGDSN